MYLEKINGPEDVKKIEIDEAAGAGAGDKRCPFGKSK